MKGEILSVGTELLLGNIANTNAQFISKQLATCGVDVYYHSVVGDNESRLENALKLALSRSDLVVLTGGLGPTTDDITKETVAKVLNLELIQNDDILEKIKAYHEKMGRELTEIAKKQAFVIKGAKVLENDFGTAPGILIEGENKLVALLPGPPRELKPMFESVVKHLKSRSSECIFSSSVYLVGKGEPWVEAKLGDLVKNENPTYAIYCQDGQVQIRVSAKAESKQKACEMAKSGVGKLLEIFGEDVYSVDTPEIQNRVVDLLIENSLTVTTAESLTGGLISQKITAVSGASNVLKQSFVTYCDKAKNSLLGVPKKVLKKHTAVSEEVAAFMALGAAKHSDLGVSATGVAGPGPDENGVPAGEVFVAVADKKRVWVKHLTIGHGSSEREFIREVSAKNALDLLRRFVENTDSAVENAVPHIHYTNPKKAKKLPLSKKILRIVLAVFLSLALILGGVAGFSHAVRIYNANTLKAVFMQDVGNYSPLSPVDQNGVDTRLSGLLEINENTIGWLSFSGTRANFPVVLGKQNSDFWGNEGSTPYLNEKNVLNGVGQNLIVFSDELGAKNPFYEILSYKSVSFYKKHPNITFTTKSGEMRFKILGAFFVGENDDFEFEKYLSFNNADELSLYLNNVKRRSLISTAVNVREGDSLITVAISSSEKNSAKFVVVGRKWRMAETSFEESKYAKSNLTPLYPDEWYEQNGIQKPDFSLLETDDNILQTESVFETVPIVSEPTDSDYLTSSDSTSHDISSDTTSSETATSSETSSEASSNKASSETSSETSSQVSSEVVSSSRPVSSEAVSSSRPTSSQTVSSRPTSSEAVSSRPVSSEPTSSEEVSSQAPSVSTTEMSVYAGGRLVTGSAEEIVAQIVANEVGNSSPIEAVKAQAVAAASFVEFYNKTNQAPSVALKTPSEAVKNAVREVINERIYYNGEVILSTYGSMAAGQTNNSEDVWGGAYPYLVSVESKYDHLAPNYRYEKTFSAQYVKDIVREKLGITLSGDENEWFSIVTYTSGGYNGVMDVGGVHTYINSSGKRVNITGRILRENVFSLRSAKFTVEYNANTDTFTFTTYGYGHGVGMSQWGAIYYAQYDNWDYKQILTHYYTGCVVR